MNSRDQFGNNGRPSPKDRRCLRYSGSHPKSYQQKYKEHNIAVYPELHNHKTDPHEWHNLAGKDEYNEVRGRLVQYLPKSAAAPLGTDQQ